jgi:uncharacterized protein
MTIEFDLDKAAENLKKHKVSFVDAEQVLLDHSAVTIEDKDAIGEVRLVTIGMDSMGRILIVVHTERGLKTRIISARKASKGEARAYHA